MNAAGCQLSGASIFEGIGAVKGTLDKMIAEGDLVVE